MSLKFEALNFLDLDAAYLEMAADGAREAEALDWSEALIADSAQGEFGNGF